jgi:hypothetical protein
MVSSIKEIQWSNTNGLEKTVNYKNNRGLQQVIFKSMLFMPRKKQKLSLLPLPRRPTSQYKQLPSVQTSTPNDQHPLRTMPNIPTCLSNLHRTLSI